MADTKNVFVVCAFGDEFGDDSEAEISEQLDALFKTVFSVAQNYCEARGTSVKIFDARALVASDQIRRSTMQLLDEADAVVVVLNTDSKPNIFIEYGWSEGFWQNPIVLFKKGLNLPSDINNGISIPYDAEHLKDANSLRARKTGEKLGSRIFKEVNSQVRKHSFEHLKQSTLSSKGEVSVFNRFSLAVSFRDWSDLFLDAEKEIIIASTKMTNLAEQKFYPERESNKLVSRALKDMLLKKALSGVRVTILMFYEGNPTIPDHLSANQDLAKLTEKIRSGYYEWATLCLIYRQSIRGQQLRKGEKSLNLQPDGFRVVQMRRKYLPFRASYTEKQAIITLRLLNETLNSGICIVAPAPDQNSGDTMLFSKNADDNNSTIYEMYKDELEMLITTNLQASEQRLESFRLEPEYQEWEEAEKRKTASN